ncbi:unnamed protein product [Ostreobium quekettii]|uniref:NAD(P)H dehydrogenase (quinone) n=1 Tax=Ostreobium quekettii TaxID=121088 RepID=A0A8S1JFB8_9CHLO|nr:unnamed protein product [Ostreobium quekettii]|eukprot:evm.model.scf_868EXC.5 EVM.evm.TU.scf_868EXC.5   scf_868EXC:47858-49854(-)
MAGLIKRLVSRRKSKKAAREAQEAPEPPAPPPPAPPKPVKRKKILIVFYSLYGHVYKMALAQKEGVESVEGCEAVLYQVKETLDDEILEKMGAAPKPDVPIADPKDLVKGDGIIFGFPTRFGMMCGQMKCFFDSTGGLWKSGALVGKPAAIFTSTGTPNSGQETTPFTAVTQLAHHGMVFVPVGYTQGQDLFSNEEARGGSPWGAGCLAAADGSRQPSEMELSEARHQGSYFAGVVRSFDKECKKTAE